MIRCLLLSTLFLLATEAKAWVVIDGGDKSIECVGQHCYLEEEDDDEATTKVKKFESKTTYSKDPLAMPVGDGKKNKNDPMAM